MTFSSTKQLTVDFTNNDCMLFDLETSQTGKILEIGAVRGEKTMRIVIHRRAGRQNQDAMPDIEEYQCLNANQVIAKLDNFTVGAKCMIGHNIIRHDLNLLKEQYPDLSLLNLPVIDTLFLSPICFPENPYHRLVKEYKLVSSSLNDPVSDARLAGVLLNDEIQSLRGTAVNAYEVYQCLRFLLCSETNVGSLLHRGMQILFDSIKQSEKPADSSVTPKLISKIIGQLACKTCADYLSEQDFQIEEARWAYAFIIPWLRVAGSDSVLPPWVRLENSMVVKLLSRLRDVPCDSPDCVYCRTVHNPDEQLKRFFGFDGFRPTPADEHGQSMQRLIVTAGMRNESHLAIMPTGGGKSLCFQLPALIRNYRRGQLTIVISPLQALMKDQVDGLVRRTGMHNAAALYGLLTSPERGEVLRGISSGRIALLYVSPEQLRNMAFKKAVLQREIGCWVLDEAHCLSKWGHDFRPDYLYTGRFIRELAEAQKGSVPAITCFTATAKQDVIEEIIEYFRRETGSELVKYEGGVERDNLRFEVQTVGVHAKLPRMHELLCERIAPPNSGSAVVFRATRRAAEETSEFLANQGWPTESFHAGLQASEKKRIQNAFLSGDIRVICATNAFGMGIDKDDVRIVIHGDTPGSLENYLQEAGRAGRDRNPSDCVLLYDEEDCEQQFRMGALSELSRRDIAQILRGLRKAARTRDTDKVVITTGELLRDEDVDTAFGPQDTSADTKVRSAVSWLERAGFVERNENKTNVVQARLLVKTIEEAKTCISKLNLSEREAGLWLAVISTMMNASEMDSLSVDEIALLPEFQTYMRQATESRTTFTQEYLSAKVLKVLDAMMSARLLKKDTLLTAYLRYKVVDHSIIRLQQVLQTDREFTKLLAEEEPDPEGWMPLNLRMVNEVMLARDLKSSTELLRNLMKSLSEDGRGFGGQTGSIDCRHTGRDTYFARVRREWKDIEELAERRRNAARLILDVLINAVPEDTPAKADLLVEFSFETLRTALEKDILMRSDIRDIQAVIERGLMFLHEQHVIILQQGLAIFRSAMTVHVLPEANRQRYTVEHYDALRHHYHERIFQVHVMNEYARYGMHKIQAALELVVAYFTMEKEEFIKRFFNTSRELLERATTVRSYTAIVDSLENRDQIRIVTQPVTKNLLILAGPGSGKTRTVVHRCAYLLRVKRVRPKAILVCCFNHKAVLELRSRLAALAGRDAAGVTVQTYHGLALRILGVSCRGLTENRGETPDFDKLITDATLVLQGKQAVPGMEPDDVRDRLLSGFEHILVDEYQDIDEPQYELIGAIAGRTINDRDRKLSILAVGDDDQSIYGFRGANIEFIKRFENDYDAETAYLTENYRSTRYIIEAANKVIALNNDRMKKEQHIRIDQGRNLLPAGGLFGKKDNLTKGLIAVVEVPDAAGQAASIVREITRLHALGVENWNDIAVLSRTKQDLALVRAVAESQNIPVSWPLERDKIPPLHRIREIHTALATLKTERETTAHASGLEQRLCRTDYSKSENSWNNLLKNLLATWKNETADEPAPITECLEFLYESLAQRRRDEQFGTGVALATVHGAKGLEYRHILLCGDWSGAGQRTIEEERRTLYVGMTRAMETLTIFSRADKPNPFFNSFTGPCFTHRREIRPQQENDETNRRYTILGLKDIFLDFVGRYPPEHPIHSALRAIETGSLLEIKKQNTHLSLANAQGIVVAQLSESAVREWTGKTDAIEQIRVVCMLARNAADCKEPRYKAMLKTETWEIPVCEIVEA